MENANKTRSSKPQSTTWSHVGAGEFLLDLQDFFYARQDRLRPELLSEEYYDYREEVLKTYEELKLKLDEETRSKLLDFDTACNNLESITKELSYRQGFSDGVRFIMQALVAGV